MAAYTYQGKTKKYVKPKNKEEVPKLFDNVTWILNGSYPDNGLKSRGSELLQKVNGSEILEYQLDFINLVSNNPRIILISGISHKEFVLHPRSNEFIIIQNQLYEFSNSAEDLRLGLLGSTNHALFIEGPVIPKIELFQSIAKNTKSKVCCTKIANDEDIGALEGQNKNVTKYSFFSPNKLMGIYYLGEPEILRLKRKMSSDSFHKSKYAFEVLTELKLKLVMDHSNESAKNSNKSTNI